MNSSLVLTGLAAAYESACLRQSEKFCFLPPHLISRLVPVYQFVSLEFILGYLRVMPSVQKVLIKRVIKTTWAPFVPEDVFRQLLYINTRVVMTEECIITKDGQFYKGDFTIKLETDVLLHFPETLEK